MSQINAGFYKRKLKKARTTIKATKTIDRENKSMKLTYLDKAV